MLRKENETLKSAQEQQLRENLKPDSSEPNSQPNHSSSPRESTSKGDKGKKTFHLRISVLMAVSVKFNGREVIQSYLRIVDIIECY